MSQEPSANSKREDVGAETNNPPRQLDARTDDHQALADTVDQPGPDDAIGDALDQHMDALERGTASPVATDATPDVQQLRPLLDKLHRLSTLMRSSQQGNEADADAARQTPPRIGKFEIRRPLGVGGQGSALFAFDPDLQRHVVIKLYHYARDVSRQAQVLNEGRALARVKSSHVAQCFGADRHEGVPYLVVEYIPGRSLDRLQQAKPLDTAAALELIGKVADGLAAVHACGLLHRDLKPSNIMVGDDGVPRLVDFGLAVRVASEDLASASGTLAYMAPEQARGEIERIDQRSDIFGLGAVLYALLTGRPPHQGSDQMALWTAASAGDVVPPIELKPDLPRAVNDLCMRCLAKDPAQRFASASELRQAIDRLSPRRWKGLDFVFRLGSRRFRIAIGAAAAVLLLAPLILFQSQTWNRTVHDESPHGSVASEGLARAPAATEAGSEAATPGAPPTLAPPDPAKLRTDFVLKVEMSGGRRGDDGSIQLVAGDFVSIHVEADRDCYVGAWWLDDTGTVVQIFPNEFEPDHLIRAGKPRKIPGDSSETRIRATPSNGRDWLHVVASTSRWDPAEGERRGPFVFFATPQARARFHETLRGLVVEPSAGARGAAVVSEVVVPFHVAARPGDD